MKRMHDLPIGISALFAGIVMLAIPSFPVSAAAESGSGIVTAAYAQGVPWDEYLAKAKVQRETWLKNAGRDVPSALVDRMQKVSPGLRLLVVATDWCPDSLNSVPYIAKLASRAGVELRVVGLQAGKAVMDAHHTPDGRASTPTVVLLRGDQEVGAWVERPASLQWWYLDLADHASEEELLERKTSWYEWNRGEDALTEIVVLAEQTAKKKQ